MEVFEDRKGITPVIAIVLLLMVTVGAVGVVYTQFNSLVGNPQERLDEQRRNQDTRIRISTLETNATSISNTDPGDHNVSNYGTIMMTIQNAGSVSRNTTAFVLTAITGETVGEYSNDSVTCFTAENSTILDPQEAYRCNTGILYPEVTKEVKLEVLLSGSAKTWTDTCHVTTTGAEIC